MKTILIVDDNPQNRYMLRTLLAGSGYQVTEAANGAEALERARRERPDAIVSDILMPVMDGFDLCRRCRRDERLKDVPFLFYTATYTDPKDEEFALGLGADRFIVKPQEPEAILGVIEEVLAGGRTERREADAPQMDETVFFKVYNEALVRKLEEKMAQLEETRRRLEREAAGHRRTEAERVRLTAAIEQTGEAIVITDAAGAIRYVNPAFETVTGYSREEAIGQNPRILKSDRQDEAFYRDMWGTISSGRTWTGRMVNRRKDGTLYTEEATISPVRDPSGRIENYVAVKRDITENLRLTAQFQQAQKMESVGTLAGGIAHDFNNVLTAILGFGEMLKSRIANDPKAIADLDQILAGAERASVLTRQILTFARRQIIEAGNIDLNRVVADLGKLLRKVLRADIEIRTRLAGGLPTIRADQGQMEQVLMNLVVNARDAMPDGGLLTIETEEERLGEAYVKQYTYMKPGRYAVLSVSDTGTGMDEATRERIFEPFFTTKGPDRGTGLGLAVVYGIVKQHNGFIHVYSEPGKGTRVRIYFPTVDASPDAKAVEPPGNVEGGSETILLAEDDESIRRLAERTLGSLGYRVLTACDGEEAVEVFRRNAGEIAIAVLDVVMPKMGGKQAYDEMLSTSPDLKVLFLSGYSADAIHDSFVLRPGIPFLQKPYGLATLARKVREVLDRK
ncbi:MAG: response regulator [Thermodesulfobacteriota bacterium]